MSCPVFCLFGIAWLLFVDGKILLRMSHDRIIEVETYAWSALPHSVRPDLVEGVALELESLV